MTTVAAQPALPVAPPAPHNVSEGFGLIWQKLDGWADEFVLLIPNLAVACIVAIMFVALTWGLATVLRRALLRNGRHDLGHMLGSFAF